LLFLIKERRAAAAPVTRQTDPEYFSAISWGIARGASAQSVNETSLAESFDR
jgi:hypothetical protein